MPVLNTADALYLGAAAVNAVYLGDVKVWSSVDPDVKAYLAATGLDPSYAPTLDGLVVGLKAKGLWSKMNAIYPFIGGTAALHQWNLKDPRDADDAYRLTFIEGNGGSHSTALGYRANSQGATGYGGYADTHFIPLGVLDQNSLHLSWYSLLDVPPSARAEIGCWNWAGANSRFHLSVRYEGGNAFYYGMSEDAASNVGMPASSGLFVGSRTGPMTQSAYRNGINVDTTTVPTIGLPPVSVWVGGMNGFASRTDIPSGFASIGSGLTDQDNADLYTIVQAYQTALGRAV